MVTTSTLVRGLSNRGAVVIQLTLMVLFGFGFRLVCCQKVPHVVFRSSHLNGYTMAVEYACSTAVNTAQSREVE